VPGNASFACTHAAVDWVVPAGVTTVDIVATGASGLASFGGGHAGGLGAKVTGTVAVTAGATLHVRAGCSDGFNGGGTTGALDSYSNGGGASDVRLGGDSLGNRVITAAGGGGGGVEGAGGSAQGAIGGNGAGGLNDGLGATLSSGGFRGGYLGQGGDGEPRVGGGGGGGGVYGGGGSGSFLVGDKDTFSTPGGGGGAGSSAGPAGSTIVTAAAPGDGSVALSWIATNPVDPPAPIPTTTTMTDTPNPSQLGEVVTLNIKVASANGPVPGNVKVTGFDPDSTIVVPLDAAGTATIKMSILPAGDTELLAEYLGSDGYLTSSQQVRHTVIVPDTTAPVVTVSVPPPPASGWFTAPVAGSVSATDDVAVTSLSCNVGLGVTQGLDTTTASAALTVSGEGSHAVSCSAQDAASNVGSATSNTILIDSIAPTLSWTGGPTPGATYVFGSTPGAPTCSAIDAGSGPATCAVTGYTSTVGTHALTATATDVAGNTTTETRSYSVAAWRLSGFYSPVDMGNVVNTVKGGSTVPLKFEVFAGGVEQTATAAIASVRAVAVSCNNSSIQDEIEVVSTGDTSLRYEGGQFIYNWKTPKSAGACINIIVQTLDGSMISAQFRLR